MAGETSSPWGLMLFTIFCVVIALAGFIWCACCGTCAGRNVMRQVGLSRLVPPPFMQPSFGGSARSSRHRKEYGQVDENDELDEEALVGSASNSSDGWWQRANEQTENITMKVFGSGGVVCNEEGVQDDDLDGYHSSVEYGYDLSDEE
ncbi:hypothetical protein DFQ27_002395 [Actinomortierella ambigua]|uniref:Uncharacterized protein n=1 Tax=Actinomortierella ambigua TaxID=1343610 RepID=A0A9P6UCY0_9FUNG|nr:hypothetical protein DFQ27_002395 [Actinomortierella ambigua]